MGAQAKPEPGTSLSRTREGTALTLAPSPLDTPLGKIIEPYREQLAPFLRDGITLERVATELILHSHKTPHLEECRPVALVDAVCRALQTGGIIGQDVYIVPFKNQGQYEPTVMVDYKFKAELVVLAGGAKSIDAFTVYEKEPYECTLGSEPRIMHRPLPPSQRGKIVGAYAIAHLGFGHVPKIFPLSLEEIEKIRAKSRQWAPKQNGDNAYPIPWYGEKCCVHRLVKLLPKSPRLRAILNLISQEEREEFGAEAPAAAPSSPVQRAEPDEPVKTWTPGTELSADFKMPVAEEPEEARNEEPRQLTLEQACAIKVNGKQLGEYRNFALTRFAEHAIAELQEKGEDAKLSELAAACDQVITAREHGQLVEPPKPAKVA